MIDVQDPSLNLILNVCFLVILGLGLVSIVPWTLKLGGNRWTLLLPFLAIATYVVYEFTMPNNWDIRVDLLLLWPILTLILLLGIVRAFIVWRHSARAQRISE